MRLAQDRLSRVSITSAASAPLCESALVAFKLKALPELLLGRLLELKNSHHYFSPPV